MKNILSFYRDCYFTDKNRKFISDIFGSDIESKQFTEGREELINSFLPYISLESEYAETLNKRAYLYRKEKDLVYCSVILTGISYKEDGEKEFYCSPLFFRNARIGQNDSFHYLELDDSPLAFNNMLLDNLSSEETSPGHIARTVDDLLADNKFTQRDITSLCTMLEQLLPGIDTMEMTNFPELFGEKELRKITKSIKLRKKDYFTLLPCSFVGLMNKPAEARGVVAELDSIIEADNYSAVISELFDDNYIENNTNHTDIGNVPSVLSKAQERALESASSSRATLIIGPPGTGKTYTIASLTMEHLSKGKTVLIASRMDQAVNVIADKIEEQLHIDACVVRGGRSDYQRELKNFLKKLLSGMYEEAGSKQEAEKLRKELAGHIKELDRVESKLNYECAHEVHNGNFALKEEKSFWEKIRQWFAFRKYNSKKPLWDIYDEYEGMLNRKIDTIRRLLEKSNSLRLSNALKKHRNTLNTFLKAISSRTGGKQEEQFSKIDFKVLLQIFPVWLVNMSDIYKVLPLEKELFDLAIIDEATQCDISACLPIMQRAKRVAITGDPNQLRHISFLSEKKQREFIDKYSIGSLENYDYRRKSILDYFSENIKKQKDVIFLNEHYRSLPQIISFSNNEYYDNRLKIMTEKPVNYNKKPVSFHKCDGIRDEKGVNHEETLAIIKALHEIITNSGQNIQSIGILSPFRKQVDHISMQLINTFGYQVMNRHKMLVGTAHSFQGEERDIMLLSLAVDDDSHNAAYRFLEKPDVFNVSITRAKERQMIFHSFTTEKLKNDSVLRKFMDYYNEDNEGKQIAVPNAVHDKFADEVCSELEKIGLNTLISHSIAGHTMDITVYNDKKSLGIDLIGYPGDFEDVYSLDRYKMFKRAGLRIFPLPYVYWLLKKEESLGRIKKYFL